MKDEARGGRDASSFPVADEDYFRDMDHTKDGILDLVRLAPEPSREKTPTYSSKDATAGLCGPPVTTACGTR